MILIEDYLNRVARQPGEPGKVKEFENVNAGSNFHANFKIKHLNIQSYIGILNCLFLILLSLCSQYHL